MVDGNANSAILLFVRWRRNQHKMELEDDEQQLQGEAPEIGVCN